MCLRFWKQRNRCWAKIKYGDSVECDEIVGCTKTDAFHKNKHNVSNSKMQWSYTQLRTNTTIPFFCVSMPFVTQAKMYDSKAFSLGDSAIPFFLVGNSFFARFTELKAAFDSLMPLSFALLFDKTQKKFVKDIKTVLLNAIALWFYSFEVAYQSGFYMMFLCQLGCKRKIFLLVFMRTKNRFRQQINFGYFTVNI